MEPNPEIGCWLVRQRRRRSLTTAQGWSASDNPGKQIKIRFNPERVFAGRTLSGLVSFSMMIPRVVAAAPTLG